MNPLEDDEDPWPDEPDEFDPDSLGPETPDVAPDLGGSVEAAADVDEDIFRAFWGSVVFLNVAIAALSVGAMLVYFRGDWAAGGPALVIGLVAVGFVGRFYRTYLDAREDDAPEAASDSPPGGGGANENDVEERRASARRDDRDADGAGPDR